ncbi:hypothetical protein BU25DRAFT_418801 [Macroventuria anomochaeta]|uniref:Uncharacterized protein n=1 Tax=Macroventuria anomochaeta TaxID=301207 RepID=A0ACB6SCZ5_9PLEO|nr:uncharacterized protein BU25DRAFT_418801 [Macroventuria anomochaeta]KAF2631184.1 hypothetical protein BU25DRAFT_418801 [Macroventuria anomochaeta]
MASDRTTGNPLSAGSLSLFMATALPRGENAKLKNGTEAIALAVHAGMLAVGFRLVGLGEDERIEAYADAENPNTLPTTWNTSSLYTFRYKHAQSAIDYHINVHTLDGKAAVSAVASGDDSPKNFDVTAKEYLSESMLPLSIPKDVSTEDAAKKLMNLFISSGRLNDLGALLKAKVIQKLASSLQKAGYEEDSVTSSTRDGPARDDNSTPRQPQDPEPARPYPFNDPLAVPQQPGRPLPEPIPGFEDEHEVNRPPRGGLRDDRYPVGIGHDDLYPQGLGPNDPLRPHLGGGFGGGMHPTFDDPLFRGQGGQGGQGGYDSMAPPGARYDPVGPGGAPRDNRRGGPTFPGGGGLGGPPNPFGGFGGNDFI